MVKPCRGEEVADFARRVQFRAGSRGPLHQLPSSPPPKAWPKPALAGCPWASTQGSAPPPGASRRDAREWPGVDQAKRGEPPDIRTPFQSAPEGREKDAEKLPRAIRVRRFVKAQLSLLPPLRGGGVYSIKNPVVALVPRCTTGYPLRPLRGRPKDGSRLRNPRATSNLNQIGHPLGCRLRAGCPCHVPVFPETWRREEQQ